MTTKVVSDVNGGARLTIRVQPRASESRVEGLHGEAIKVRLRAPPVDGAANDALVALLAEVLGVSRRDVAIVAGHASRSKIVHVAGLSAATVERLLIPGHKQ